MRRRLPPDDAFRAQVSKRHARRRVDRTALEGDQGCGPARMIDMAGNEQREPAA
jgi:hypothetical protein